MGAAPSEGEGVRRGCDRKAERPVAAPDIGSGGRKACVAGTKSRSGARTHSERIDGIANRGPICDQDFRNFY